MLIAPFDEHSHVLDDHRLGVLYREAVGELIAEAFPAPDGCQVITGISECILGAKLLAPWVRDPSVRHRYTTDKYDKEATRVRYFILGMYDARVRCLLGVIETGVTDRVLGGDDCANLNPGGVTSGRVAATASFGFVYTNVFVGKRERAESKCQRCMAAGKPIEVCTGHTSRMRICPSR